LAGWPWGAKSQDVFPDADGDPEDPDADGDVEPAPGSVAVVLLEPPPQAVSRASRRRADGTARVWGRLSTARS
jgi:hypothetical protein